MSNTLQLNQATSVTKDITETLSSGVTKFKNLVAKILSNKGQFFKSINDANITPNNIGSIRILLLAFGALLMTIGQKELGTISLSVAAGLDFVDGELAKSFNKKSKEGELYDAGIDKISDITMSIISICLLINNSPMLATANGAILAGKVYQHYKGQARPGRPSYKEQGPMFYNCFFRDQDTQFIEHQTESAAKGPGKYKTTLQFIGSLGIMGISIINSYKDIGLSGDALNIIFTTVGLTSLHLGNLSNSPKTKK